MALFKKKDSESEGAKEWEQTLTAEDEPREGDSEFRFKFGRTEEEEAPEEDAFLDEFDDEPVEETKPVDEEPEDDLSAFDGERAPERPEEPSPWEDEEPYDVPPPTDQVRIESAEPVQHPIAARKDVRIVSVPHWTRRRRETISEIEREIDRLKVGPFTRPKDMDKWLTRADGGPVEVPGAGLELIPPNIRSKRICYETEGGFVVEVEYRDAGDVRTKYYSVSNKEGRNQALASIKSGAYARVTTITDEMIEAIKTPRRRKDSQHVQSGKVTTWPIENKVNVTDIEGVGDEYQGRLKEIGYYTTDQLRLGIPKIIAAHIGVREQIVRHWQAQAELILVKGVGPQLAELMVRAGVDGIEALQKETPKSLVDKIKTVREGRKVRITGAGVGTKRAQSLIRAARAMKRRLQDFPQLGPSK